MFKINTNPDIANTDWQRPNIYGNIRGEVPMELLRTQMEVTPYEEAFGCSGFCTKSLFFFTKSVEKGRPKETCLKAVTGYVTNAGDSFLT
jgi:hypothetical protein